MDEAAAEPSARQRREVSLIDAPATMGTRAPSKVTLADPVVGAFPKPTSSEVMEEEVERLGSSSKV